MADETPPNGTAPPDEEFVADLDALAPRSVPFVFDGVRYAVLRFEDVPTGGELLVLRLEQAIKAATTVEELIDLHLKQARVLAPSVPDAVLARMNLRQLKHLGQVSLGARPPRRAGRAEPGASSSSSPAPPASTVGATTT
jgi:hypothetical protein